MSSLIDSIKKDLIERPNQAKLSETSKISDLVPSEIKETIGALYKEKSLICRLMATFLNSIFTQHRAVFLFSYRIMADLVANDKNLKTRKTISGKNFKEFMVNIENNFIERIACGEKGEHRAAVYKLKHKELLNQLKNHITNEIIKNQELQCLEIFNSYAEKNEKSSRKSSHVNAIVSATVNVNANVNENDSVINQGSLVENLKLNNISLNQPKENRESLVQNDQPTTYRGFNLNNKADNTTTLPTNSLLVKKTNSIKDIEQTISSFLVKKPHYAKLINALAFIHQNDKTVSHNPNFENNCVWAIDCLVDILNGKDLTPKQTDNVWRIYDKNLEYKEKKKNGEYSKKTDEDEVVELKNPFDHSKYAHIPGSSDVIDEEFMRMIASVDSSPNQT